MLSVEADVVEGRAISRPYNGAGSLGDDVRQLRHTGEVAYPDGEKFSAGLVRAPRQQLVIGRMRRRTKAKEYLPGCERVPVDQDLAISTATRLAADRGMLAAFAIAAEIRERAVGGRNVCVVLPDTASHFRDQRFLLRNRGSEHRIRIRVLVLEMLPDHRVEQARVAHHRLPACIL